MEWYVYYIGYKYLCLILMWVVYDCKVFLFVMCNLCELVSFCGIFNWNVKRGKEMDSWYYWEMIIFYIGI